MCVEKPQAGGTSGGDVSNGDPPDRKERLEQYRNVLNYARYENTTYWARAGFFLIVQSALLAILARLLTIVDSDPNYLMISWVSLGGIILAIVWWRIDSKAHRWMHRWQEILAIDLEEHAYGDIEVFRGVVTTKDEDTGEHKYNYGYERLTAVKSVILVFILSWALIPIFFLFPELHTKIAASADTFLCQSGAFMGACAIEKP